MSTPTPAHINCEKYENVNFAPNGVESKFDAGLVEILFSFSSALNS